MEQQECWGESISSVSAQPHGVSVSFCLIPVSVKFRESKEFRESKRVVSGDIPQKGVVRCSLDSCLLLSPETTLITY